MLAPKGVFHCIPILNLPSGSCSIDIEDGRPNCREMKRPAGSPDIAADALKSPNFFSPEKKTSEKSEEKSWNSFGDKKGNATG